jgi:glycosyltransferase involved in cell wall biosynthesis
LNLAKCSSLKTIRVLVVHNTRPGSFGDRIRVEKVQQALSHAGSNVFESRLPVVQRFDLLVPQNLKNLFVGFFSLNKIFRFKSFFSSLHFSDFLIYSTSLEFLRKQVQQIKPDVILAETSKVGLIASVIAKEYSIPCVVDVHGLIFAEAFGSKQKNWRGIIHMEIEAFKNSDYIVVVSKKMRDYIIKKMRISEIKIIVAPNGSDPQEFHATYSKPLRVIYAGGFTYWEKVHDFIEIAKRANPQKFEFYLAGDGPLRNELLGKIKKENIAITYLGSIPKQKIFRVLSKMQIGIAPSTKDLTRQVASPVKIFDYLSIGLPVVTPRIGDWGDLIADEDCGIALETDSIAEYLKALDEIADEIVWTKKSLNALKVIAEKCSWSKALLPLTCLLSSVKTQLGKNQ